MIETIETKETENLVKEKKSKKKPPLTPEEKNKAKIKRANIRQFVKEQHEHILISIFNEKTAQENRNYCKTNPKMRSIQDGACYCSPTEIKQSIPYDSICYVLEMHNHINKIAAIGRIKAKPRTEKHNVYEDKNYHHFYYLGKYRITREEMTEEEETIMKILDILCFTGNTHMKRTQGLRRFPQSILYDIATEPKELFKQNKKFKPILEKPEEIKPIRILKKIQKMFSDRNYI
jgi:hypothetical protein